MSAPTILFTFGGISVYLFGVTVMLGLLAGTYVVLKDCERKGFDKNKVSDLILWLAIGGIIGARVLYILLNFAQYKQAPLSVFSVHEGGLAFHGAVIAGIAVLLYYAVKNRISFLKFADLFVRRAWSLGMPLAALAAIFTAM